MKVGMESFGILVALLRNLSTLLKFLKNNAALERTSAVQTGSRELSLIELR